MLRGDAALAAVSQFRLLAIDYATVTPEQKHHQLGVAVICLGTGRCFQGKPHARHSTAWTGLAPFFTDAEGAVREASPEGVTEGITPPGGFEPPTL